MILNASESFRGAFFDIRCDYQTGKIVKSFPKGSNYFLMSDSDSLSVPVIAPRSYQGKRRDRHCFSLPNGHARIVDFDLALIRREFADELCAGYVQVLHQLQSVDVGSRSAPVFCRYQGGYGICEELITCIKASNDIREAFRISRAALTSPKSKQRVHGTLSVGNTLIDSEMRNPCFLFDNGAFIGPIEYDIATSLETYIDLLSQRKRLGLDSADLGAFVQTLVSNVEQAQSVDRCSLKALTVYQYVGHLNLFQKRRRNGGKPSLPAAYFWHHIGNFFRTMDDLI